MCRKRGRESESESESEGAGPIYPIEEVDSISNWVACLHVYRIHSERLKLTKLLHSLRMVVLQILFPTCECECLSFTHSFISLVFVRSFSVSVSFARRALDYLLELLDARSAVYDSICILVCICQLAFCCPLFSLIGYFDIHPKTLPTANSKGSSTTRNERKKYTYG